jgi:hypothetical protein
MKIFISQKMRDLTEEEILKRREMIINLIKEEFKVTKVEIIESWHPDFDKNSIWQLGRSIQEMSEADLVLVSDISLRNIQNFKCLGEISSIKGSEFEVLMCMSYEIPYKVYVFEYEEKRNPLTKALSIKWL